MRYANNGQVIAVAANQENPMHTGVLFASPLCDTVLPVNNYISLYTSVFLSCLKHYFFPDTINQSNI
jgi:hypothetical protein